MSTTAWPRSVRRLRDVAVGDDHVALADHALDVDVQLRVLRRCTNFTKSMKACEAVGRLRVVLDVDRPAVLRHGLLGLLVVERRRVVGDHRRLVALRPAPASTAPWDPCLPPMAGRVVVLRVGERGADAQRHDRDRREGDQLGATEELHGVPPVRDAIALRSRAVRSRAEAIALRRMSYSSVRLPVNRGVGAPGCAGASRAPLPRPPLSALRRRRFAAYAARPVCAATASSTSLASRGPSEGRSGVAEIRTTTSSPSSSSSVIWGWLRTGVWMAESSSS